jgi:hypothetical protein
MEYRHCKYTVSGAYVCKKKGSIETFANMVTPSTKTPSPDAVWQAATAPASFNCSNYAKMNSTQKKDAACVVLKRYDMKEVNDYFACSSRDPYDGMITCKNKSIIESCVPANKRIIECNRCCPQVDPNAPALTRDAMQQKRDACMYDCKKSYDPNSLKVTSAEKPVDPNAIADPNCVGQKEKQVQCYTDQCKKQFGILCIKNGMTLPTPTKAPASQPSNGTSQPVPNVDCVNACKKQVGCAVNDKSCTTRCGEQCIKAGYVSKPAAASAGAGAGHSCSGTCKKKAGCNGPDCDMMCNFNCTF